MERAVWETARFRLICTETVQLLREVPNIAAVPHGNGTDITQIKKIRQCEFCRTPFKHDSTSPVKRKNPLAPKGTCDRLCRVQVSPHS